MKQPRSARRWGVTALAAILLAAATVLGADQSATKAQQQKKPAVTKPKTPQKNSSSRHTATTPPRDSVRTVQHPPVAPARRPDTVVSAAPPAPRPFHFRKILNTAFQVGERLVFDVNYGFVTAGEAVMSIPSFDTVMGRKCYRVEFSVNSLQSFAWIYKVEDRYLTYIDVDAIVPLKFEQHIREGTYSRDFIAQFDQVNHVARTTEGEYPIPEYVHDIMSAFYYFRTIDFSRAKPGDEMTLYNFYKDKSYELVVRFLGRRELEVAAGTFNTIVVEPLVKEGGLFKSEGRIVIWLTDDDLKVPVRVNTKVVIGSIDTELREYSGLAGDLRARIK